jgi:hypothetical protein
MSVGQIQAVLRRISLRSGTGVYPTESGVHRIEAVQTLLGIERREVATDLSDAAAEVRGDRLQNILAGVRKSVPSLAKLLPAVPETFDEDSEPRRKVQPVTIGLRASAVTFISEIQLEDGPQIHAVAPAEREDARPEAEEKRAQSVLTDRLTVSVGKQKIRLTAKVRFGELHTITKENGLSVEDQHRYEPEPWAAWRASAHYAPFKPTRGVHLRYILGESTGLAVLGTHKWPLAWQVLSWEEDGKAEALLQAYHLLNVHALRRLKLSGIEHVSVQGDDTLETDWEELEQAMGHEILGVDGPEFDESFTAFGLALGTLDSRSDSLNLARSIQEKPSLLAMAPWGETGFIFAVCVCMFLILQDHASGLAAQLQQVKREVYAAPWARGQTLQKLTQEQALLAREVTPMIKFLDRELQFSRALDAVATELPATTWLVNFSGGDFIWEKNPNKALGQRYLQIDAGAPSAERGMAPPEINQAVRSLESNEYMKAVMPRVKLTDVNWRQQNGSGFTVFGVLSLPKN